MGPGMGIRDSPHPPPPPTTTTPTTSFRDPSIGRERFAMGLPRLVLLGCLAGAHAQAVNGWTRCTPLTRILDCGPFLVCAPPLANLSAPPICRVCHADADCADMGDEMECVAEEVPRPAWRKIRRPDSPDQTRGECVHKLLLPMDVRDMLGFILIFFACAVAAGGGIGGGGMLVPILLVVFGFDAHDATPLSNVAILGGTRRALDPLCHAFSHHTSYGFMHGLCMLSQAPWLAASPMCESSIRYVQNHLLRTKWHS